MSVHDEVTRINNLRDAIRTKLIAMGIGTSSSKLSDCVTAVEGISTQSAITITPSTTNQTVSGNKLTTGAVTIKGDVNLNAANIKSGVSIFGVTGTY